MITIINGGNGGDTRDSGGGGDDDNDKCGDGSDGELEMTRMVVSIFIIRF